MQFTEESHNSFMMQALDKQRENKEFCDMALSVDQNVFYGHRSVLAAMSSLIRELIASNDMKTDDELFLVINPKWLSSGVVEELLAYFYTGKIIISEKNVEKLLKGAKYFSSQTLKSHCSDYLLSSLKRDNSLHYMFLAIKYDMKEVRSSAYEGVRDNFDYWASPEGLEDLVRCPPQTFGKLLRDVNLHVQNEDQALLALFQWVKHKMAERQKYFKKCFAYIRLPAVSSKTLLSACQEMSVFQDHSTPLSQIETILSERQHGNPQSEMMLHGKEKELADSVVILGGQNEQGKFNSSVFAYIIEENIWVKLSEMPYEAAGFSATSLGTYIYVTGGTTDQITALRTAWKFDMVNNSWIKLPDLPIGTVFHTLVTCGGAVYSVGGSRAPRKYISDIFQYDEGKEEWVLAGKMSIPMDATTVITKGEKAIYIVTGRRLMNGQFCRIGVVDCFDVQTRDIVQCITFPIQFIHKPLLSFPQENILSVQSHKGSFDINLQKINIVKSMSPVPLLPNNSSLDLSHAVCPIGKNKVFVCGGLNCPGNQHPDDCCINREAYLLDQNVQEWKSLAEPPEALDGPACCTAKLSWEILQKTGMN